MSDEPKKLGRPSKYKPEYCERIVEFMGKGFSVEAFAGDIMVHVDSIYEWEKVYPDFSEAKKLAFGKNRIFWENIALQHMTSGDKDPKINSAIWIFNMKNRFKWRDMQEIKQEVTGNQTITVNQDNILDLIKKTSKDK
jgi:transposase